MSNPPTYLAGAIQTKAYRILRRHVYAVLNEYGINSGQWSLLGIVAASKAKGVQLSEAARYLDVKPPLVTMTAEQLVNEGLIIRSPHLKDQRAKVLTATPEGKKLVRKVEKQLTARISDLLDGVTMKDMAVYQKVLETVIQNDAKM
jgi:DNA-binding MarR family transcriptional regulator